MEGQNERKMTVENVVSEKMEEFTLFVLCLFNKWSDNLRITIAF